jgi:tRNA pseudouridine32 synthase/23S rRNA pseudouridine746 synthase
VQKCMHRHWRAHWVQKTYCAIVEGFLPNQLGTIHLPLATDWPNRPRQHLNWVTGKASTTHWRKLPLGFTPNFPCSRLMLIPVTGRTHQLRVHLQSFAHPILGDRLYHPNASDSTSIRGLTSRLHLHASTLRFRHPITGKAICLIAQPPF